MSENAWVMGLPLSLGASTGVFAVLGIGLYPKHVWPSFAIVLCVAIAFASLDRCRDWLVYGLACGASYAAPMIPAFAPHGWRLAAGAPASYGATVAAIFVLGAVLARWIRVPISLALPITWLAATVILDRLVVAPLPLFLSGIVSIVERSDCASLTGIYVLDALLLWTAASCGRLVVTRNAVHLIPPGLLLLCSLYDGGAKDAGAGVEIAVVQPVIPASEYEATGWSLVTRRTIGLRVEHLVREASALGADLIVLPENATAATELQVTSRMARWRRLIDRSGASLVVPSNVFSRDAMLSAVAVVDAAGSQGVTYKANPVPLAESGLSPGGVGVLALRTGLRVGALVCWDSMFGSSWRALVEQGAGIALIVSNDESFGRSSVVFAHTLMSQLWAREHRIAFALASNAGPSVIHDRNGRRVAELPMMVRGAVSASVLPRSSRPRYSDSSLWLSGLILCCLGFSAWAQREQPVIANCGVDHGRVAVWLALAVIIGATSGVAADVAATFLRDGISPAATVADWTRRHRAEIPSDGIGRAFLQSDDERCGPAALAFLLTRMGYERTEADLAGECADMSRNVSIEALAACARQHDFAARALSGVELPTTRHAQWILHLRHGHFVVLIDVRADQATIFDPAKGAILTQPVDELKAQWSGYLVEVAYLPVTLP